MECSLKTYAVRLFSESVIKPASGSVLKRLCSNTNSNEIDDSDEENKQSARMKFATESRISCHQPTPSGEICLLPPPPRKLSTAGADRQQLTGPGGPKLPVPSFEESVPLLDNPNQIPQEHLILAEKIWNYMLMHHPLHKGIFDIGSITEGQVQGYSILTESVGTWKQMKAMIPLAAAQSDLILVLGNVDIRVAEHGARLWLQGYGKWLMVSGFLGNLTKGKWHRSEADIFREVALRMGVPDNRIIVEDNATNTGENIRYSFDVLRELNLKPTSIILVQMPFMERRTYATFMKQWPGNVSELTVSVSSPPIPLKDYPNHHIGSLREVVGLMMGCLQRIREYPKKGFQIHQDIPEDVWDAFEQLKQTGFYDNFRLRR